MRIIGIDPSFTGTGLVSLNESGQIKYTEVIKTDETLTVISRVHQIINKINDYLGQIPEDEAVWLVIEGMSFDSKGRAVFDTGYLGYRLREEFAACQIIEPTPTQLKKFCLGKGNGKKNLILQQVYKKWGEEFQDDNIADAYVLARIGLACAVYADPDCGYYSDYSDGSSPLLAYQQEVILELRGEGKGKKAKKKSGDGSLKAEKQGKKVAQG